MILRIAILFDSAVVGMVYPADGLSSVSDVLVFVGECLSGVQVSGPDRKSVV